MHYRMDRAQDMRIATRIDSHDVIILINSQSTQNFITKHLANRLRLLVMPTETFIVRVTNEEHL